MAPEATRWVVGLSSLVPAYARPHADTWRNVGRVPGTSLTEWLVTTADGTLTVYQRPGGTLGLREPVVRFAVHAGRNVAQVASALPGAHGLRRHAGDRREVVQSIGAGRMQRPASPGTPRRARRGPEANVARPDPATRGPPRPSVQRASGAPRRAPARPRSARGRGARARGSAGESTGCTARGPRAADAVLDRPAR